MSIFINWYNKSKLEEKLAARFIARKELERRLEAIGWDLSRKNAGDYMAFAPDGVVKITMVSEHNWDKSWIKAQQHILRQNKDLTFVFDPVFNIPKNFNARTQKLEIEKELEAEIKIMPFVQLNPKKHKIYIDNKWHDIIDIDYAKKEIMLDNGEIISIKSNTTPIQTRTLK